AAGAGGSGWPEGGPRRRATVEARTGRAGGGLQATQRSTLRVDEDSPELGRRHAHRDLVRRRGGRAAAAAGHGGGATEEVHAGPTAKRTRFFSDMVDPAVGGSRQPCPERSGVRIRGTPSTRDGARLGSVEGRG